MSDNLRTLANGAVYDMERKRIVSGAMLTSDSARQMVARRTERKQAAIIEAANKAAQLDAAQARPEVREIIGADDLSFVRAVAVGRMGAAMDASSPYGNAAAQWLTENAGLAEAKQTEQTQAQQGDTLAALYAMGAGAADAVLAWLAANSAARVQAADVVDAVSEAVE